MEEEIKSLKEKLQKSRKKNNNLKTQVTEAKKKNKETPGFKKNAARYNTFARIFKSYSCNAIQISKTEIVDD